MSFLHPEALLLVPVALLLLRGRIWPRPLVGVLRVAVLLLLAAIIARPSVGTVKDGRDVILVVDRSRSMPEDAVTRARELAQEITAQLAAGDRIGVVEFGAQAAVVSAPVGTLHWPQGDVPLDRDGSDLAAGMAAALAVVPSGRQASLLVVSDGEVEGDEALAVARLAARRSIRVDADPIARQRGRDAAIADLRVPAEIPVDAPFAVEALVLTTHAGGGRYRLVVDGEERRSGRVQLRKGRNLVQLQHRVDTPGEHHIELELSFDGDVVPQNDRGLGVVRGTARTRILCVTPNGREDRLTRSLRAVGLEVVVCAADVAPLTLAQLDGYRAVLLEDVPASQLPAGGMRALATWVRELGGGLLMTGGARSFGVGGYYQSPIESVLPVTLEIREEQRRFGLAMAIALDRSGSMGAQAGDATKMELANRGAAGAVDLLAPIDAVAVLAVDTAPEVVVAMQPVDDSVSELVRRIESGGGGIYVGAALHACAEQLEGAAQENKHIVLFADADDAEEPTDYETFVPELVAQGVTVSVIGLGTAGGRDAPLLEDLAQLGNGRCQFVADAAELPRVFAQETIQVARSSMIEEATAVVTQPSLLLLGDLPQQLPALGGYSITWPRERAELDAYSDDENDAPVLAHWQVGLGRAAAFLGEADGDLSGEWATWHGYADFFATVVRWLSGGATTGVFVEARRDGDTGVYQLEVDAARAELLDGANGLRTAPDGGVHELAIEHIAAGILEIRVPLRQAGVHRAAVQIDGETVRLPPLSRPYSAEWSQQLDARAGERNLRLLARRTGGALSPSVREILAGPRASTARRDVSWLCACGALVLLLVEIAVRRLQVRLPALALSWPARRVPSRKVVPAKTGAMRPARPIASTANAPDEPAAEAEEPEAADATDLLGALARAQRRGKKRL